MKKAIYSLATIFVVSLCAIACSSDNEEFVYENETNNILANRISLCLDEVINSCDKNFDDGGYIIYDSESDSIFTCSGFIYDLIYEIYDVASGAPQNTTRIDSNTHMHKAPKGSGWKYAGTCSGTYGSLKLAKKIAKEIPSDSNFEIHVEHQADGSNKVWYRIV